MKSLSLERISRSMSHALRHAPEAYSITLTEEGFVPLSKLAKALSSHFNQPITVPMLLSVVEQDNKQRYTVVKSSVRAAQGHSFPVKLNLPALVPPVELYHGTVWASVSSILEKGLIPGKRQFVHLSSSKEVANTVGARRGAPVVLVISAKKAHENGVEFFQAENGVWLVSSVPSEFISVPN